ncbi:Uncharacterised protein [Staphylococcus aureus]|nr:Uncharacterised protein [Staphylococcus aureus]SBB91359.1 Uncharacterised protein [Staphylococcus aureus]
MKKSIYILPLAYIVIESPLQIGNVILTPSLKVIESGHFHTDFSLISMFNKKRVFIYFIYFAIKRRCTSYF